MPCVCPSLQAHERRRWQPVQPALHLHCAIPRRRACIRRLRPGQNLGKEHEALVARGGEW